ncbi:hypothetical protein NNO95_05855 [Acinetobacter baumannii]|uniref:hypothetical protein n=1 Tax=Acinetobacter baumannii TaxID=470 RepID=UPI0020CE5C6A|nr:hypothetical protein [Acinetobacter baumannii]MCQ1053890.1 hypothetical protein [Acinetobacter baumannii]
MSNNILTHAKIAKEAAAMLLEKSIFIRSISRSREKEFAKELDGYKIGNSVKIKIPPVSNDFLVCNYLLNNLDNCTF